MEKSKNVISLVKAFIRDKPEDYRKLEIVGKGSQENSIFREIHSHSLNSNSNIEMIGYLERVDVRRKLCQSTFFISLSLSDGMPIAVLEALACGCIPLLVDSEPHLELKKLGFIYISIKSIDK